MPSRSRDASFVEFVAAHRQLLVGAAYLMFGGQRRAEDVVEASLAQLYLAWPPGPAGPDASPLASALHRVLYASPGRLVQPWQRGTRIELVDSSNGRPMLPAGIVTDLAHLRPDQRRVIILERFVQLRRAEIAMVIGVDLRSVHSLADEAMTSLATQEAERRSDSRLEAELREAAQFTGRPGSPGSASAAVADLGHGQSLVRRRLLRQVLVAGALVLTVVVGITQIIPIVESRHQVSLPAEHNEPRGPVPSPARSAAACNVDEASCRVEVARQWRTQMSALTSSYVDPDHHYFSGFTYSDDRLYQSDSFWSGRGGALGFDMSRVREGATDVYVQIATSQKFALTCGQRTHRQCHGRQYLSGNTLWLTDSTRVSDGLEIQYAPTEDQIITVVARNTSKGHALEVSLSELVELVQDPRLQLPVI
jgi:DNA-directed RNA polymerase specialized sigma24 family protein